MTVKPITIEIPKPGLQIIIGLSDAKALLAALNRAIEHASGGVEAAVFQRLHVAVEEGLSAVSISLSQRGRPTSCQS